MRRSALKSFVVDGSESSVQDVVSKLKFIAKIKEGDIIDVSSLNVYQRSIITSLYRTLFARNESKEATLNFFRSTIDTAFDLVDEYLRKEEGFAVKIGLMIAEALGNCKQGLKNHISTYTDHTMHISRVEALISTLDAKLEEMSATHNSEEGDEDDEGGE